MRSTGKTNFLLLLFILSCPSLSFAKTLDEKVCWYSSYHKGAPVGVEQETNYSCTKEHALEKAKEKAEELSSKGYAILGDLKIVSRKEQLKESNYWETSYYYHYIIHYAPEEDLVPFTEEERAIIREKLGLSNEKVKGD